MQGKDDLQERIIKAARQDLLSFCLLVEPNFMVGPHHRLLSNFLMDIADGNITRGLLCMPPRSSKSFLSSQHFPAWLLGRFPSWQTIMLSHSTTLATDFSRDIRSLVASDIYQHLFPGVGLRPDSRAADRWHTNHRGIFFSGGVGSNIAGRGANMAILDDPLSEQSAMSKSEREGVNRWYFPGLDSRLSPTGRVLITATRWHSMDLSGYVLDKAKQDHDEDPEMADNWNILSIPAILDDDETLVQLKQAREELIETGILPEEYPEMKAGETYWPPIPGNERAEVGLRGWTTRELLKKKRNYPAAYWQALYMQNPVAEEGNIIKRRWWKQWEEYKPPECEYVLVSMDTAYSKDEQADYSSIQTWGIFRDDKGIANMILLAAEKGRWEYIELKQKADEVYQKYHPDAMLIEKRSSGFGLIGDLRMRGIPVLEFDPGNKDKIARAYGATPLLEGGRVWAPIGKHWADEVISECAAFPAGANDDHVDAFVQAATWLRNGMWISLKDDWQEPEDYDTIRQTTRRKYY